MKARRANGPHDAFTTFLVGFASGLLLGALIVLAYVPGVL